MLPRLQIESTWREASFGIAQTVQCIRSTLWTKYEKAFIVTKYKLIEKYGSSAVNSSLLLYRISIDHIPKNIEKDKKIQEVFRQGKEL